MNQSRKEINAYSRALYAIHPEKYKVRSRVYYATHREEAKAHHRVWYAAHREDRATYNRAWRTNHVEKVRLYQINGRKAHATCKRLRIYGLSQIAFDILLNKQGGVCAICKKAEKNGRELSVDHDHVTGKVRGLLCKKCNSVLGYIADDSKIAQAVIDYLRRFKKTS